MTFKCNILSTSIGCHGTSLIINQHCFMYDSTKPGHYLYQCWQSSMIWNWVSSMAYELKLQCQKWGKIFSGPTYRLLLSFFQSCHMFTGHLFHFSKLPLSFEINGIGQWLVHFTDLAGIVNTTVYKTEPISTGLTHGILSWFLTLPLCIN